MGNQNLQYLELQNPLKGQPYKNPTPSQDCITVTYLKGSLDNRR